MRTEKNMAEQYQNHHMKYKYVLNMNIFSLIINKYVLNMNTFRLIIDDIKIMTIKIIFHLVYWVKYL